MNLADRLGAIVVLLGLVAVAACGSSDGSDPAGRSAAGATGIPSSDVGTILFTRQRSDGKPALFTIAPDGSRLRLFVTNASYAAVSQDGRRILFVRGDAVWLMRRDGSGQRQVTRPPRTGSDYDPAWSPGGRVLYFSREEGSSNFAAAFSMRLDGTALHRLTPIDDYQSAAGAQEELAPSPDGRIIAYTEWIHGFNDYYSILAMTPAGRKAKLGFRTTEVSDESGPAWAPDGERLAFAAIDVRAALEFNRVGLSGLYVSSHTGAARRVFRTNRVSGCVSEPAWSADGEWIVFAYDFTCTETEMDSDIWIVPADGAPARRVTSGRAADLAPTWLPAG